MMGELWFKGPDWLSCPGKWPQQPEVSETVETAKESVKPKFEKQLLAKEEEKIQSWISILTNMHPHLRGGS